MISILLLKYNLSTRPFLKYCEETNKKERLHDFANNAPNIIVYPRESVQIFALQVKSVIQWGINVRMDRYKRMLPVKMTRRKIGLAALMISFFQNTTTNTSQQIEKKIKIPHRTAIAISESSPQDLLYSLSSHDGKGKTERKNEQKKKKKSKKGYLLIPCVAARGGPIILLS